MTGKFQLPIGQRSQLTNRQSQFSSLSYKLSAFKSQCKRTFIKQKKTLNTSNSEFFSDSLISKSKISILFERYRKRENISSFLIKHFCYIVLGNKILKHFKLFHSTFLLQTKKSTNKFLLV